MISWKAVQSRPGELVGALKTHAARHSRSYYADVRATYNRKQEQDPVAVAAQFIYLNKTCFNGLHRVNRSGKFNVPVGSYRNPAICDADNLAAVSQALKKADLECRPFERISPERGDLVYCDPPYDGTFSGYAEAGFDEDAQKRLASRCAAWRAQGVFVVVSNNDTPFVRSLYRNFTLHEVSAPKHINSDGNGRGRTAELLIVG